MKKWIASILTLTILFTASAMMLAENGKSKGSSSGNTGGKLQGVVQDSEESLKDSQNNYEEQQKRIEEKRALIEAKKATFQTKKDEFEAFKDLLFAKKKEMLALRYTNNMLHAENAKLQGDLRSSLESMTENGLVLSDDITIALEECMAQIKEISASLKESKGQIQDVLQQNRGFIRSRDYVSMETAFEEIYAIQQYRNECLTQINTLLQNMIRLLVTVV